MLTSHLTLAKYILFPEGSLRYALIIILFSLLGLGAALVEMTGGTHLSYLHVMYLPIVMSGFIFSVRGGLLTGIFAGILLGPFMLDNTDLNQVQPLSSWLWRMFTFTLIGGLSGFGAQIFRSYIDAIEKRNTTDSLTGLPNLEGLKPIFKKLTENRKKRIAVIVVDLFQLRNVDHALGIEGTTQLIKQVAKSLEDKLSSLCIIGHLHSKRFALLVREEDRLNEVLEKCRDISEQTYQLEEIPLFVEMRFGIASYPHDDKSLGNLTRKARIAIDHSIGRFGYYQPNADENAERNLLILHRLHKAIENKSLELHYQPKIDFKTMKPVGFEALVRWKDPLLGHVSPADFIPLTEETTLINPFTKWLIEEAVKKIKYLHETGHKIHVAINFSMKNFLDPTVLAHLYEQLSHHKISSEYLELEVTETAVTTNMSQVAEMLAKVREKGLNVAIDDFGTGQSSQQYLLELPVDIIKIDRVFISVIEQNPSAAAIVKSAIQLGHDLGLKVVAEGIETEEEAKLLKKWGCDIAQGYYFGKPMPDSEIIPWLLTFKSPLK